MHACRVLIYDCQLVAEGLCQILRNHVNVMGAVFDSQAALLHTLEQRPDVLIVDPALSGSMATVLKIRAQAPSVRILFLAGQADKFTLGAAIRTGVAGVALKTSSPEALRSALSTIARGKEFFAPELARHLPWARALFPLKGDDLQQALTNRQTEVLRLVALGKTAREIGRTLGISPKTAEFHKAGLMNSLGIETTAGLIRFAVEQGMLTAT